MTYSLKKCYILFNSPDHTAPECQHLDWNKSYLAEWSKKHPMPSNSAFKTIEDAVENLSSCNGCLTVGIDEPVEFIKWFEALIQEGLKIVI